MTRGARGAVRGAGLDTRALVVWAASRVAVAVTVLAGAWTLADATAATVPAPLTRLDRWDVGLFVKIARYGYFGRPEHYPDKGVAAFFPGEPLLLRAVRPLVGDWVAAGLVVSLIAGAVAAVAIARLGELESPDAGQRAVGYWVLSPYAVFLAVGYSEAVFLAFALPCWLAARRGRWALAGLLGAGAGLVRVTGVFLGAALVVEYAVQRRRRVGADAAFTLGPWAAAAGYFGWLAWRTGDWLAWPHAQAAGWGRRLTDPLTALRATWRAAGVGSQGAAYAWAFRAEIVAVAVGVALTAVLIASRRWAEATYVGGQVAAFATSSFYLSVGRATLLWWPLWLLLARASLRRRSVHVAYLALAPPLMFTLVLAFSAGRWVG